MNKIKTDLEGVAEALREARRIINAALPPPGPLKECPFCGKKSFVKIVSAQEPEKFAVICDSSTTAGQWSHGCGGSGPYHLNKDQAIKAWNKRAEDTKMGSCPQWKPSDGITWQGD